MASEFDMRVVGSPGGRRRSGGGTSSCGVAGARLPVPTAAVERAPSDAVAAA